MDWSWLWQGLVAHILYGLLIVGWGVLIALLRRRASSWAAPALYGAGGAACLAIALFAFVSLISIPPKEKTVQVTPQNVEDVARSWLDTFGLSTRKLSESEIGVQFPSVIFAIETRMANGDPIDIVRNKEHDHYIIIMATLAVTAEHQAILKKLSTEQNSEIIQELQLELARARITNTITWLTPPILNSVIMQTRIPITSDLTEDKFMETIDQMGDALVLARNSFVLALGHAQVKGK